MKSKTYQKEGWLILEEYIKSFGESTEDVENEKSLESEDLKFNLQNKDKSESNIDSSSEALTDFFEALVADVPEPSEEEVRSGIEKILGRTHPDTETDEKVKNGKTKVFFKALFVAALLSALSFSCLFAIGSKHNISIENGFVTFAKDTVKIVFFEEENGEYITVDALLTDLEYNGFEDVLLPEEFVTKSDKYKVSMPEYRDSEMGPQVTFIVVDNEHQYSFTIHNYENKATTYSFKGFDDASTIIVEGVHIYIFDFENTSSAEFIHNGLRYAVISDRSFSEMVELVKTLNFGV